MRSLRLEVSGEELEADHYAGADIRELAALRDKSSA
jgi:hypothetical protein